MKKSVAEELLEITKSSTTRIRECKGGLRMSFYDKNDKLIFSKKLALITEAEAKKNNYGQMGSAGGQDLCHCLYIATRHAENFCARVVAYSVNDKPKDKQMKLEVTFWEKKEAK